ncbi:MAG: adenylate/guanylate cyclase domain-containing protein [Spirochaetaceae bacterium]|nr:MAG: adenylate/guanylate cyclase domain-containing protein [Spirochaetaceae bacterium]
MRKAPRRTARKALLGALIGLAAAAVALALAVPGLLDGLEGRTWDWRVRLLARKGSATDQIALILLDQKSLDWAAEENALSWPWPRETYALVADFCRRGGARALAFDVLFTEASSYGLFDDERFGSAVAENGMGVVAVFLSREEAGTQSWPAEVPEPALSVSGLQRWLDENGIRAQNALELGHATFPIPELTAGARVLANVHQLADADGVFRRGQLFNLFDGKPLPSLALGAYLAGNPGAHSVEIDGDRLVIDDRKVPIDSRARVLLRYRGPSQTHVAYNAAAVLQSELRLLEGGEPPLDPSLLKDRYVFFGFTAPGLYDLRPSPVAGTYPGVEINATMLDNLLSGDFMRPLPWLAAALLILALSVGAGLTGAAVSTAGRTALVYVIFLPLAPALSLGAYALGWWLPLLAAELGVGLTLVSSSLVNYATEGRQKRYIKGAFKQYLSPEVIEQLIAHPERLKLGGERRELTIFFSDLQGFTSLSEGLSPEDLTSLLNEYLSAMTDIIQEEGGTIDKYEGDAIIAFWNAPLEQPDHAVRGVRAALRCQEQLAAMRPDIHSRVGKELLMRIGMNSGPAVVGNMGSRTRFDYTMLGDTVNLAARLEGVNKQFRTYTMVSEATVERASDAFPVRELGRVAVVGRKEPVTIYEPMLPEHYEPARERLAAFAAALTAFYAGKFAEAEGGFTAIAAQDPAAAAYADKCRALRTSPPTGVWNGVWLMTSK